MNELSWWWPNPERLHEVLLSDAEAHSPAVALAVHQPMFIRRRRHYEFIDTPQAETVDESAILAQLHEPVGDGCQVVLIEGKSGTGKSHVVRWLEIQLERRSDRSCRVVVPVSKGSRLRDIVRKISERPELAGDTHAELRQQLSRAQEPIDPKDAASRLCQQLSFVCEARADAAKRKQQEGRALSELEKLQKEWGDARQLPHLLVYNPLRPLLVDAGRSTRRLVEHLHARADPLAPRTEQEFVESDLVFDEIPEELDDRARRILSRLEDAEHRREAVHVLNDALDEAKRSLLHLNPGVVQDVFKSIRSELLIQGKELVLLVEDFADLSGLQKEILQAAIQTGSPGGTETYCPLRTVLAFTDGILKEETVLSRAQHIYYVPNLLSEEHVIDHSVRLVASYLQAARFGAAVLEGAMREAHDADRWLPAAPEISDDATAMRDAFGVSEDIPLFPFTRSVVERLVRDAYGRELLFIPRDIIRDVMPRVLQHREAFVRAAFPPDAFRPSRAAQLTDEQSQWLKMINPTGSLRHRLESFLLYWGLNAGAARAFGLPEPDSTPGLRPLVTPATRTTKGKAPDSIASNRGSLVTGIGGATSDARPIPVVLFGDECQLFQSWRTGSDIASNQERNAIRKATEGCLRPAFAWAWRPRIEKASAVSARWNGLHEWIEIAGLRLSTDAHVRLTLVTPEEREDKLGNEALTRELVAVRAPTTTWDVEGIEMHLAAHLSFIERHREEAERHRLGIWHSRSWDALPFLVTALAMTGAVLGVKDCGSSVPEDFIDALFADPPEVSPREGPWRREVAELRGRRASLRTILEMEIGAYQGAGDTVHAIDAAQLLPFVPNSKREPPALPSVPNFPPGARADTHIENVMETAAIIGRLAAASVKEIDARRGFASQVRSYLAEGLDKDALITALGACGRELKTQGALTEEGADEMKTAISALKKAAVVAPLESTDRLVAAEASVWKRLVSLGRNEPEFAGLAATKVVLDRVDTFLRQHERHFTSGADIDPLDEALAAHETQLGEARALLGKLTPPAANEDAI
jgi:hypothetical protein